MIQAGKIVLFQFPKTDLLKGKLRPALLLGKLPGNFDDFLICMISSQLHQAIEDFDELVTSKSTDFIQSGLKADSVFRISRLAVIQRDSLLGSIGEINTERLQRIKNKLANWICSD